ncbi:MAG: type 1 glutamine amidotransferase domain-containing protein [Bdellovibrionales bacterium]|nr:type 1 glutamine amidotransferase domain-containing protein [Bdellovibrionales bacterium]
MSLMNSNSTNPLKPKKIAIVIANPATSSTTGWPVGFWWSELTHPYFLFKEAGYAVSIFSPDGGSCQADGMSDPRDPSGYSANDLITMGFVNTPSLLSLNANTKPVASVNLHDFDAMVVAGGQAPMFNFEGARTLQAKFMEFYDSGKPVAALCHGVSLLRYLKSKTGEPLVRGKTITGFANSEEDFADRAVWQMKILPEGKPLMPWRIEDELKKLGANFATQGPWREFAVRDGNLITGQQNFSGAATARLVIEALGR